MKLFRRKPVRRITIFESPSKLWYFHVQGDNAKVIAPSEGYTTKAAMMDTLDKYFPEWDIIEDDGKFRKVTLHEDRSHNG